MIKIRAMGGNHSRFFCQGSWNQLGYGILQLGLGIDIVAPSRNQIQMWVLDGYPYTNEEIRLRKILNQLSVP